MPSKTTFEESFCAAVAFIAVAFLRCLIPYHAPKATIRTARAPPTPAPAPIAIFADVRCAISCAACVEMAVELLAKVLIGDEGP